MLGIKNCLERYPIHLIDINSKATSKANPMTIKKSYIAKLLQIPGVFTRYNYYRIHYLL